MVARAAAPSVVGVIVAVGVAVGVVGVSPVWRVARFVVTLAHEGGHALAAVLTGRRLAGIRVHSDTSGLTVSRGRPRGPGMVLTAAAGYPAPGLLGLAGVWLTVEGHAVAVAAGLGALLVVALVLVRNVVGALVVLGTAAVLVGGLLLLPSGVGSALPLVLCLVLVAGAVRSSVELGFSRRARGRSDADALARLTHVPAVVWVAAFVAVTAAAAVATALVLGLLGVVQ
nr:M50 family metallopeptidase [Herbiconiux flava]